MKIRIGICFIFFLFAGIFLSVGFFLLPRLLIVNEPIVKSDVIVVLGGHNLKSRILQGVSLYRQGYAPRILLSGGVEMEKETGISLGKMYLQSLGVPEEAILLEGESRSTRENALYTQKILEKENFHSFILVTSPFHTLRSKILFKKVIAPNIRWSVNCDPEQVDFDRWWGDVSIAREIFYEALSLPYCFLFNQ